MNYLRILVHRYLTENQEDTCNYKSLEYFDKFPYIGYSFYVPHTLIKCLKGKKFMLYEKSKIIH